MTEENSSSRSRAECRRRFFRNTQAGYFFHAAVLQPFVRYERLRFRDDRFRTGDQERYGAGFNWYVSGQNLKVTPFWERLAPAVAAAEASVKDTNHFVVQLQFSY